MSPTFSSRFQNDQETTTKISLSLCTPNSPSHPFPVTYTIIYGGIDGFEHQWGHRYLLAIEVEEVADPPADGSSLNFISAGAPIEETPVAPSTGFALDFFASDTMDLITMEENFGTIGDRAIRCSAPAVCDDLASALGSETPFRAVFHYDAADMEAPLVLKQVAELPQQQ